MVITWRIMVFAVCTSFLLVTLAHFLFDYPVINADRQRLGFRNLTQTSIALRDYPEAIRWAALHKTTLALPLQNLQVVTKKSASDHPLQALILAPSRGGVVPFHLSSQERGWILNSATAYNEKMQPGDILQVKMAVSSHTAVRITAPVIGFLPVPSEALRGVTAVVVDASGITRIVHVWAKHHVDHIGVWLFSARRLSLPAFFIHPTALSTAELVYPLQTLYSHNIGPVVMAAVAWIVSWRFVRPATWGHFVLSFLISGGGLWWWTNHNTLLRYHTLVLPLVDLTMLWVSGGIGSGALFYVFRVRRKNLTAALDNAQELPPMQWDD